MVAKFAWIGADPAVLTKLPCGHKILLPAGYETTKIVCTKCEEYKKKKGK